MAKRTFAFLNLSWTAQALSAALTSTTYAAIKGGSTTQLIDILEIYMNGLAAASTIGAFLLCRVSTIATTETALAAPHSDGPNHPATAALAAPPVTFVAATAGPFASNSTADGKITLGQNLFGGIVKYTSSPTQQFSVLGSTASLGEAVILNASGAGGVTGSANGHMIYEPY